MRILITTKKDGFRRAGIAHTGSKTYEVKDLTTKQLAALKAEPMLVVVELPDEPAKGKPKKTEAKKTEAKG
jgi:hypothetical protein